MAVSSSVDFSLTGTELVTEARSLLGINADEEALQNYELVRGLRWLTIMLKAWQADGVEAWTYTEGTFALVASTASYTIGSGGSFTTVPIDFRDMRITRNSVDMPMRRMSREEYFNLPNKTNTGYPTQWMYDRQRDNGTLYVWPSPDSTAGTLKFTCRRRIMDMDAGTDNFDLPQEWYMAITYGLAVMLIPHYGLAGTPAAAHVIQQAGVAYSSVKNFDVGEGENSISILPDGYAYESGRY